MKILLIEDDELLGSGLRQGLSQAGFVVEWVQRGDQAEGALRSGAYDCLVLDWQLPGRSGMQVLQGLRARGQQTPVLMLTARDALQDRVQGLDAGADDYLVKPVALEELSARLRALIRRSGGQGSPVFTWGELTLDPARHECHLCGMPVSLSAREFSVLARLISQPRRPVSAEQLTQALYSWDQDIGSNAVEVHIHHLRKKLGSDWIKTIRGVGYVLNPDKA